MSGYTEDFKDRIEGGSWGQDIHSGVTEVIIENIMPHVGINITDVYV